MDGEPLVEELIVDSVTLHEFNNLDEIVLEEEVAPEQAEHIPSLEDDTPEATAAEVTSFGSPVLTDVLIEEDQETEAIAASIEPTLSEPSDSSSEAAAPLSTTSEGATNATLIEASIDKEGENSSSKTIESAEIQAVEGISPVKRPWAKLQMVIDGIGILTPKGSPATSFFNAESGSPGEEGGTGENKAVARPVAARLQDITKMVLESEHMKKAQEVAAQAVEVAAQAPVYYNQAREAAGPQLEIVRERAQEGWIAAKDTYSTTSEVVSRAITAGQSTLEDILAEEERLEQEFSQVLRTDALTDLRVEARSAHSLPYLVQKGCSICWQFRVKDNDLGFALRCRTQEMGGAVEHDVIPMERYPSGKAHTGMWTATEEDRYVLLVWDNTYSLLTSKVLAYKVEVTRPSQDPTRTQPSIPVLSKERSSGNGSGSIHASGGAPTSRPRGTI